MAESVLLNIVIISILIGAKLAGVMGAIVAVPVATALTVYLTERGYRREEKRATN